MGKRFAELLTKAINLTKAHSATKVTLAIIQDQLGHALGRNDGSAINYWRRGNLPTSAEDVLRLAEELAARQGLNPQSCEALLKSANYPNPKEASQLIFKKVRPAVMPESPTPLNFTQNSPFIVGPPILLPSQFYGREQEIKRIFALWKRKPMQNIAVIGTKRSGKSSLLHYVKNASQTAHTQLRPDQRKKFVAQWESLPLGLYRFSGSKTP